MKKRKKLRAILLYSSGHLGSKIAFNLMLYMPEIELVGVIQAKPIPATRKGKSVFRKYVKSMGWRFALLMFLQWVVMKSIFVALSIFPGLAKNPLKHPDRTAKSLGIPTMYCKHINSEEPQNFIRKLESDIVISAYFSQLIENETLRIPKYGFLNIHPGWLPKYRGALSYFWVLKNKESHGGVSIHWMDEGIDTGNVLARKKFLIKRGSTQQHVMVETAIYGARLVQGIARKILSGTPPKPLKLDKEETQYFAMPTAEDYAKYAKRRHFFRVKDTIKFIFHGIKIKRKRKKTYGR